MRIHRQLLVAWLMLLFVTLSCIASTEGQAIDSEVAWGVFRNCVGNNLPAELAEYWKCFPRLSVNELEAIREHDLCLIDPDCLVVIASVLGLKETRTAEGLPTLDPAGEADTIEHGRGECTNLSLEECTNAGGHLYSILAVGRDTGKCTYNDRPYAEVWREINFENGRFKLGDFSNEAYDGHTRIAENTYQWVNPDGKTIETVTFTLNGHIVVDEWVSGDCITDITYTLKE